jgi:hypothetical protein
LSAPANWPYATTSAIRIAASFRVSLIAPAPINRTSTERPSNHRPGGQATSLELCASGFPLPTCREGPLLGQRSRSAYDRNLPHSDPSSWRSIGRCPPFCDIPRTAHRWLLAGKRRDGLAAGHVVGVSTIGRRILINRFDDPNERGSGSKHEDAAEIQFSSRSSAKPL